MTGEPETVKASIPLWRRVRAWAFVCLLYGIIFALAVAGLVVLWHTFGHSLDITERIYRLIGAALLLALPALIARQLIRSKRATGSWLGTTEEGRQRVAQCAVRPQRRITPQQRSLVFFVLHWANITLRDPQSPISKRLLAALALIVYALALLAICALSIILVGAGIATFTSFGWMMVLFGLIVLIIPAQFIAAIVHRRRTQGDLRSSQDDLSGIMAARGHWFQEQRQQSLRTKLISTAICVAFLTAYWLRVTVYHSRHPHESRIVPFFWTLFMLYLFWNQFRRPKSSPLK